MSDEAVKKRLQRARSAARSILEQAGYQVSLSRGIIEAKRKSEVRRIIVYLSRRDLPKPNQLPPGYETWLKIGRNKFL